MKKILLIFVFVFIFSFVSCDVTANAFLSDEEKEVYNEFIRGAKQYDGAGLIGDRDVDSEKFNTISVSLYQLFSKELKDSFKTLLFILLICVLSSVVKTFMSRTEISAASDYGIYCTCSAIIISSFKTVNDLCVGCIENLSDFMDLALPTYITVLVSCGYSTIALSLQSLFMVVSALITHVIKELVCPLLFCCGIVSVVGGISKVIDFSGFIKLTSKIIKYVLGVIMTVFGGVITFAGFSASATDSIASQTARFAVANFVPVVGGCLSGALNAVKQSSILLKNSMGYAGFIILVSICIVPLFKIITYVFVLKLGGSAVHLFSETKISSMLDTVCEVLTTLGALVVFISVIFILFIGVISSVG